MSISSTCGSGMSCGSVACHKSSRPSRGLNGNFMSLISFMQFVLLSVFSALIAMASCASTSTLSASGIKYFDPTWEDIFFCQNVVAYSQCLLCNKNLFLILRSQ
ncbi:hypothetical protein C0J52_14998 [Blattella germanica]|nr:hypothetical protein C0J52_14998 [Blattella germanica]